MAWTYEGTKNGYGKLWRSATIKPGADANNADRFATKIIANEARYRAVEARTGTPWFFTGALHSRESSCDFGGVLHNGDKIIGTGGVTTHVPEGRGPFATWEDAAVDALKLKDMHRVQAWPVERMLYQAEVFNGLGYVGKGINSPYVWAGTNHEQPGKYVADHVFDRSADDTQLGVAAVLLRLAELRPDIAAALTPESAKPPPAPPPTQEIITMPPLGQNQQIDMGQLVQMFLALMGMLAQNRAQPQPAPESVKPVEVVVTPPPAPPSVLQKPSVQIGTAGLAISTILQALGVVGPPSTLFGAEPTTTGTLATLLPLATTAIGMTGGWGSLVSIGLKLFGALAKK